MKLIRRCRIRQRIVVTTVALGLLFLSVPPAQSQKVRSEQEVAPILALEQISVEDGVVQGLVRNKSDHTVREVQLFVRYTWLWDDERNPGKADPGTSTYYTLKETIQSNSAVNFVYKTSPPRPKISGGSFDVSLSIAGFTEIIPQSHR